jgi:hypothetical protein
MQQNSSIPNTVANQRLVSSLVSSGDLRFVDAHRLLFPEDTATIESMELREMYDNHHPKLGASA